MGKKGFFYNQDICVGCKTCQLACKDKNDLPVGKVFRYVRDFETGVYPDAALYHYAKTCNHCKDPICVKNCPVGAMWIDEADGTVQHNDIRCVGCQRCVRFCPFEVPKFFEDLHIARKCDACKQLRAGGEQPACVAACPMRALQFGELADIEKEHPDAVNHIAILASPDITDPCTRIEPKRPAALAEDWREVYL